MEKGLLEIEGMRDISHFINQIVDFHGDTFLASALVYRKARQLGWIIQSGLNYGTDYLLYRKHPELEHAPIALVVHYCPFILSDELNQVSLSSLEITEKLQTSDVFQNEISPQIKNNLQNENESNNSKYLTWRNVLAINRVCASAKKRLVVAHVTGFISPDRIDNVNIRFLSVSRWCPESDRN